MNLVVLKHRERIKLSLLLPVSIRQETVKISPSSKRGFETLLPHALKMPSAILYEGSAPPIKAVEKNKSWVWCWDRGADTDTACSDRCLLLKGEGICSCCKLYFCTWRQSNVGYDPWTSPAAGKGTGGFGGRRHTLLRDLHPAHGKPVWHHAQMSWEPVQAAVPSDGKTGLNPKKEKVLRWAKAHVHTQRCQHKAKERGNEASWRLCTSTVCNWLSSGCRDDNSPCSSDEVSFFPTVPTLSSP